MASEAKSARAGGVRTVCEMPNTNPPATTVAAFKDKVERASEITDCDIRFFFGLTEHVHIEELKNLFEQHANLARQCCGVKLYLDHSTGNQKVEGGIVEEIFKVCAELDVTLVAHCEDAEMNTQCEAQHQGASDISLHSEMRPAESEAKSIEFAISLARSQKTRFHVAHLSTAQGIELVRQAKAEGLPITCEVSPHHLFLTTEDYEHLGTLGKMNPPLRSPEHQAALWAGIADGTVDCVSTDHAPHTLQEKAEPENPLEAPSGVPGVETMLPLLLTVAAGKWPNPHSTPPFDRAQGDMPIINQEDITRLCFENPNRIFGLKKQPEEITVDLDAEWTIAASELHSQCTWTPYEGWKVQGRVIES